jgi:AraC family transcriptional regulator of adaptative response / DNA-3-methyladenine glycosylase II
VHRLLVAEVGATPMELAVSRRSQTARLLLEQTELSMTEIAFAAGFSSIRSFNEVMRAEFGATPSELRAMRRSGQRVPAPGGLTLRLPRRLPYDNPSVGDFLAARTIPGVERHESLAGGWRHTRSLGLRFGVAVVTVESYDDAPDVLIRAESLDLRDTATLVSRLRRWLDLDADPDSIAEVLSRDADLAALLRRRPGLRVVTTVDPWETLVRAVVGQQVSVAGARTMLGRLVDRLSAAEGAELAQFPTPQAFVDSTAETLASIGMPVARGRALRDVALAVIAGDVDLSFGSSPSDVADELVSIRGIGPWTADYVRLRGLADPDAFPAGDLVIRRVATDLGIASTARELVARSLSWSPWRAYAATHLWAASADTTTKESR